MTNESYVNCVYNFYLFLGPIESWYSTRMWDSWLERKGGYKLSDLEQH